MSSDASPRAAAPTSGFVRLEPPRLSGPGIDDERERARRRGHAAGYAEGMRLAAVEAEREAAARAARTRDDAVADRARLASALAALDAAQLAFGARADEVAETALHRIHELAIELSEAILGCELSDATRSAASVAVRVSEVAGAAPASDAPIARLSPRDAETLTRRDAAPGGIPVEIDPELAPGDAEVRVVDGAVDLRVGAALGRARAALAGASA